MLLSLKLLALELMLRAKDGNFQKTGQKVEIVRDEKSRRGQGKRLTFHIQKKEIVINHLTK